MPRSACVGLEARVLIESTTHLSTHQPLHLPRPAGGAHVVELEEGFEMWVGPALGTGASNTNSTADSIQGSPKNPNPSHFRVLGASFALMSSGTSIQTRLTTIGHCACRQFLIRLHCSFWGAAPVLALTRAPALRAKLEPATAHRRLQRSCHTERVLQGVWARLLDPS